MLLKDMFAGADKPKMPKPVVPAVDQRPAQNAAAEARKRMAMARGRGGTDIVSKGSTGDRLGSVG